jgi:hypothetical protein
MDQGKQPRRVFCARVSETAYTFIQERAERRGVKVSEEARLMLQYAAMHMPEGWHPIAAQRSK